VLTRLLKQGREVFGVEFDDLSREAKRWQKKIYWARRKAQRIPMYHRLLEACGRIQREVQRAREELRAWDSEPDWFAARDALSEKVEHYLGLFERVISQTRRRVVNGETVPAQEKLLSIFEPHTDLIVKGRKPEFGHKLTLTVGSSGLVLDCVIERGCPKDDTLAVRQIERQAALYGRAPRDAAFDGGFASRPNLEAIKALGTERCAFSKPRGLTPQEMAGSRRTYGRLKNFRAGVEAAISLLKRAFGLRRCQWRGWAGYQAYTWSAVFAANLVALVRLRL
jgi:IS5 family transposase